MITTGGSYTGNYLSSDPLTPAITIATAQPVLLLNCIIQSQGNLIQITVDNTQLSIQNCTATGLNPNVAGVPVGQFLEADNVASLDVEHNAIVNCGGYALHVKGFTGTGGNTIKILYNTIANTNGRFSDGQGGYQTTGTPTPHAIILETVIGAPGAEIGWNQITNTPGQSYVNDIINIYDSSGTSDLPILVHDNFIQGLYAIDPATQYDSGCGIITDGQTAQETAFVKITNNDVVATGNAGIGIAAGHDILVSNNRCLCSGLLPDGSPFFAVNVGIYGWDQMQGGTPATFFNNAIVNNTAGWVQAANTNSNNTATARQNNFWLPDVPDAMAFGNNPWPAPPNPEAESKELADWQLRLAASNLTVGPPSTQASN